MGETHRSHHGAATAIGRDRRREPENTVLHQVVREHLDWHPAFLPDGRLLFSSDRSGNFEIWIAEADGSRPHQLTRDGSGAERMILEVVSKSLSQARGRARPACGEAP
jgi:hypothetical protein